MNSFVKKLRRWKMRRILRRYPIPQHIWQGATQHIVVLQGLDITQLAHLRELTTWFLYSKSITGAQGLDVTLSMRVTVAAQACLLILNLNIDYFDNWIEVILYPGAFKVNHERTDAIGLVHSEASTLTGESWLRGPVILSWEDVERDSYQYYPGRNIVLHEFAHKLDGRNGIANGQPPLHHGVSEKQWAEDLSTAYKTLCLKVADGESTLINRYAATNPAEFFAVLSEYYFTAPDILRNCCPNVHRQLTAFYQQAAQESIAPQLYSA